MMKSTDISVNDNEIQWNPDTTYALGLIKTISVALGFWPTKNRKSSGIRIGVISFFQFSLLTIFIKDMIIYGNCGTILELVDAFAFMTCTFLSIFKMILSWLQQKKILQIVNSAIEDWSYAVDKLTREFMMRHAHIGRIVLIYPMLGGYMTIIPLIMTKLPGVIEVTSATIKNSTLFLRNIPIGPRCWVPLTMPDNLYLAYYFFISFHLFIMATAYLGVDAFIFGIAMHLSGQFELLYKSLDAVDGKENSIQQHAFITKFTKRHDHLLRIANHFEDACNMIIFCEVAANTFLICISGIILLWGLKVVNHGAVMLMILRILVMYIQLFMYSYVGENLSNQTEKLQVAIYNCPWYKMSPQIVKNMKFIMMRSNYNFHMTAGKICFMNISNFKDLARSMFSYFSLLRLMFEN